MPSQPPAVTPCPDEMALTLFAQNELPPDERKPVEAHLSRCDDCRRVVSALVDATQRSPEAHSATPGLAREPEFAAGSRLGRYVLLERVGAGGMGVVYAAFDPRLDRKVALKVLRRRESAAEQEAAKARLVREAQALARLSHPNVVPVFDVGGGEGEELFIALEFVVGTHLGEWARAPRPWREVLDVYLAAGQGLAAAHRAGLVHRDFKPHNVLRSTTGAVRVTDFGLAASAPPAAGAVPDAPASSTLTSAGARLGTPAYMSPEQLDGRPADARSDQFSYCVSLYEALYGERPFEGARYADLQAAVARGPRPPPGDRAVPGWLRAVLLRGLALDPAARFASLDELLRALQADPAKRRRPWLRGGALAAAFALVVAAGPLIVSWRSGRCHGGQAMLDRVWSRPRSEGLGKAFGPLIDGDGTFLRISKALDAFGARWVADRAEACEATVLRAEQSERAMEARLTCLDRRLADADALLALLERPTQATVDAAAQAVQALELASCRDAARLLEPVPPPSARLDGEVKAQRAQLSQVKARLDVGARAEALALTEPLAAAAEKLGYEPLLGEVLYAHGLALKANAKYEPALQALRRAAITAEAGKNDVVVARVRIIIANVLSQELRRMPEADEAAELAAAAVRRVGSPPGLSGDLALMRAGIAVREGRYEQALSFAQAAWLTRISALGADHFDTVSALQTAANIQIVLGRNEEARVSLQGAIGVLEAKLGPDHPSLASAYQRLGSALRGLHRYDESITALQRGLAIAEARLTKDDVTNFLLLTALASTLREKEQPAQALEYYQKAVDFSRRVNGPDHTTTVHAELNLAVALSDLSRLDEVRATLEKVLPRLEAVQGKDHPEVAICLNNLGTNYLRTGKGDGLPLLLRAVEIAGAKLPKDHPNKGIYLHNLSVALARAGQWPQALAAGQESLRIATALKNEERIPKEEALVADVRARRQPAI